MIASTYDIRNDYFMWLCQLANMDEMYEELANEMFSRKFQVLIAHDENRAADGKKLRSDYAEDNQYIRTSEQELNDIIGDCTVLEMLIALAKRMDYELDNGDRSDPSIYFWEMLSNLQLDTFIDDIWPNVAALADDILNTLVNRTYEPNGSGGLFPLTRPVSDQRYTEIWYQMFAYLDEKYPI